LDFNISEDEVLSAIKKLKRNKSGELQLITNDILMAGKFQLAPSLTFLFNNILISGIYPGNWSRGYISPIFKSENNIYTSLHTCNVRWVFVINILYH
jgi:hypothetical protein